jgi:hypothetical protein
MGGEDSPLPLIHTQMKKQTAVDQLRDRLLKEFGFAYSDNIHEELKAMEKQYIMDAVNYGCSDFGSVKNAEQYYNETYNNTQS